VALCVDLDGTLLRGNILVETILQLLRRNFTYAVMLPIWLCRGRAFLKQQVAQRIELDPRHWPYRPEVVAYLQREHVRGRSIVLATASDLRVARAVARHLGLFQEVFASDGANNLKGVRRAHALNARFGARGYVYVGDSWADLPVWSAAAGAVVVGTVPGLAAKVGAMVPIEARLPGTERAVALSYLRVVRPHHWVKNLLLLVPAVTAHRLADVRAIQDELRAIVAMCLVCSAVYVINDLVDLSTDRIHGTKRFRPLANGDATAVPAILLALAMLIAGALVAAPLPESFGRWIGAYFAVAIAYSFLLKRLPIVDVTTLAFLYTVRVLLGAAAIDVAPSSWLVLFVAFLFLSLALLKRYAELDEAGRRSAEIGPGRGYRLSDRAAIAGFGVSVGFLSALVLALYVNSHDAQRYYSAPGWLWGLAPLLLLWLGRAWIVAFNGNMHGDPIVYALRDPASYAVLAGMAALTYCAV
jgi:4-hydroxybenzoate polyprenyltransferase/phosphoserine phosphatase